MKQYTADNLVVHPGNSGDPGVIVAVTPEQAGWDTINFQARRLAAGESWSFQTGGHELALVTLGGVVDVTSSRGQWANVGGRAHVFAGPPHTLYLPPHTDFMVTAQNDCEFAVTWVQADGDYPPVLVTPEQVTVEIRGGDHATRHINNMLPPGFACQRLVVVEVYTPGGNWSSYPPHKHDEMSETERELEEIYYFEIKGDEHGPGMAFHSTYGTPERPIDVALRVSTGDTALVPHGWHGPCVAAPGYDLYYLNVMAGPGGSEWLSVDDPCYGWLRQTWDDTDVDPRLPYATTRHDA